MSASGDTAGPTHGGGNGGASKPAATALTEGRAAFRTLVSALEAGDECARHAALLRALARGRAPADAVVGLRAHLRACGACRATLAELR